MAISKGKSNRGGNRQGAGRKPKAFTVLKRRMEAERIEDAEYAFALFVTVMRSSAEEMPVRLDCAREVMDRVMGRPKQTNEHSGPNGKAIPLTLEEMEGVRKKRWTETEANLKVAQTLTQSDA